MPTNSSECAETDISMMKNLSCFLQIVDDECQSLAFPSSFTYSQESSLRKLPGAFFSIIKKFHLEAELWGEMC